MQVKTYEEIYHKKLTIRDLVENFNEDTQTGRVTAFNNKLNVRPPYQREFIYDIKSRQAVIDTVMKGYPLNVMYWAKVGEDEYELMDGQQRTLSICKFHEVEDIIPMLDNGKIRNFNFDEFDDAQTKQFLDYPLTIYICDGTEEEKLAWFRIINIAGIKLTEQEMRNAIYTSPWVTDAKRYFSNIKGEGFLSEGHVSNGHTYGDYLDVVGGSNSEKENAVVRQKLLEIVLEWATDKYNRDNSLSGKDKKTVDDFMRINKTKANAIELWRYYEDVIEWVKSTFPTYRAIMKKVEWGLLYNEYHDTTPSNAEQLANTLFEYADEISNQKEIYRAVLSGDMKWMNARAFSDPDKKWAYKQQSQKCAYCHEEFDLSQMHGDHIRPWSKGGKTERANLQLLCSACNIKKSAYDVKYKPWDTSIYEDFDLTKWDTEESQEE